MSNFNKIKVLSNTKDPIISIRKLVIDKVKSYNINAVNIQAKIQIADFAKKCYNIPELSFTNHYPDNIEEGAIFSNVIKAFEKLNNSLDCVKKHISPINHNKANKDRIEKIIRKYLGNKYDMYEGLFYKSDIRTSELISERGSFRVVSLYTVEPKSDKRQKHSKHYLTILFFDPYHLFIPSKDYGTKIYDKVCMYTGECKMLAHYFMK